MKKMYVFNICFDIIVNPLDIRETIYKCCGTTDLKDTLKHVLECSNIYKIKYIFMSGYVIKEHQEMTEKQSNLLKNDFKMLLDMKSNAIIKMFKML